MIKPAPIDPPEVTAALWAGFTGRVAWDIGANVGQNLHHLAAHFETVVAFEPATECLPQLWQTCVDAAAGSSTIVILKPHAISEHDGDITLAALPDKIDTGQLVTPGTRGMEWDPDTPAAIPRTVSSRSIDSLLDELPIPDFIKVDVEGHERAVLDGAKNLIAHRATDWLIEFHTPELYRYCRNLLMVEGNYRVEIIRHPHYPYGSRMYYQHGWIRALSEKTPTD